MYFLLTLFSRYDRKTRHHRYMSLPAVGVNVLLIIRGFYSTYRSVDGNDLWLVDKRHT